MKHKKNLLLSLIAILAILSIVSCGGNELPTVPGEGGSDDANKPVELPLEKSEDLSAWQKVCEENSTLENSKFNQPPVTVDINIQVTGTVTLATKNSTYITDANNNVMLIYGEIEDETKKVESGDTVTVSAKKVMKWFDNFQTKLEWADIAVDKKAEAPVEPELVTTQTDFNSLGQGINLRYIKIYGRVVSPKVDSKYKVNLYTELPTLNEEEMSKKENVVLDENTVVEVRPESFVKNIAWGDIGTFIGITTANGADAAQLKVVSFEPLFKMPLDPKASSITEWHTKTNGNTGTTALEQPLIIKGITVYQSDKDTVILDKDTGKAMILRQSLTNAPKVNQEMTVTAISSKNYYKVIQCEEFTHELGAENAATKEEMIAKAVPVASHKEFIEKEYGLNGNHILVKIEGEVVKSGSNYDLKLVEGDTKNIFLKYPNGYTKMEVGKKYTVYGVAATNGKADPKARVYVYAHEEIPATPATT